MMAVIRKENVKKQKSFPRHCPKFSGSFNFGVIRQFGVPGICVDMF